MAAEIFDEQAMTEVMNMEAEPSNPGSKDLTAPGPDIPALCEKLAVLVSRKAKKAIGVQLTHEQVKHLSDKDVEKYIKRYETYVSSKTTA